MKITDEMIEAAAKAIYLKDYAPHGSAARWDRQEIPNDTLIQCRTLARAALTAALHLLQQDWQPIETAPKDGTSILTCEITKYPESIRVCWWKVDMYDGEFWQDDADSEPTPTNWMPPPEPPKAKP